MKEDVTSVSQIKGDGLLPNLFGGYDRKIDALAESNRQAFAKIQTDVRQTNLALSQIRDENLDRQGKVLSQMAVDISRLKGAIDDLGRIRDFERENPVLLECIQSLLGVPRERAEYERSPKLFDRLFNLLGDLEDALERTGLMTDRNTDNVSRDFVRIHNDGVESPTVVKPAVKRGAMTVLKGTLIVPKGFEPEPSANEASNVLKKIDLSDVGE